jgi:hypothetical protein
LLTFFAAAKKVSAAPHRGEPNRPIRIQGEASAAGEPTKTKAPQATNPSQPKKPEEPQKKPNSKTPPARQTHKIHAQHSIPIYECRIHILEISKKPPYNSQHQARKAP